jgi:hypothetical protein
MNTLFASIDLVSVSGDNSIAFQPGQLVSPLLNAAVSAASVVVALLLLWIVVGWLFRLARAGLGQEETYDYKSDNPWSAGGGGIFMPAEYGGAIAHGATVIDGEREVTVHSSEGDITMSRGDYDRWFGLVDHEETQGDEHF